MSQAINRMQFLRGDFSGKNTPIRPPWALSEQSFTSICNACGDCIRQCPAHIIKTGRGGYPEIDFSRGECAFCADCVTCCNTGALKKINGEQPWSLQANIDAVQCIAFKGVECRSCFDPCEPRAIRIQYHSGGITIPILDEALCNGCGACVSVCPTQAIKIQHNNLEQTV